MIRAGERLRIPDKKVSKRAAENSRREAGDLPVNYTNRSPEVVDVKASAGPAQIHRVRSGDTLWSLSNRYGVRESDLRRRNGLREGKVLRSGTLIIIREALPETYTVKEGDSLVKIARKFGMETEELMARNGIDSGVLTPGLRLVLFERGNELEPVTVIAGRLPVATEEELAKAALPRGGDAEPVQARAVRVAKSMLFTPYVWGGTSLNGMDCSGFVWKVFSALDLKLPRSAREQYQVGMEVDRNKLSVGDLVFFSTYAEYPSHVGIYLGDDQFIHVSSISRHVKITSINHPYYKKRYIGARRFFLDEDSVVN
jgi:LysM repeat protein